jgi:hypothetical protein
LSEIRGCWFYLGNHGIEQLKNWAFQQSMKKKTEIGEYLMYSYIFGLPFLDQESVGDCFSFELVEIQPNNKKMRTFTEYLVENYIDNNSLFSSLIWAEKNSSVSHTTSSCESFHSKFNSQFYSVHLNIINLLFIF